MKENENVNGNQNGENNEEAKSVNQEETKETEKVNEEQSTDDKKEQKKGVLSQEDITSLLDDLYGKCLNGIPLVSQSVKDLADDYIKKNKTKEEACKDLINKQVLKCTTSGFLTGFGGIITLPVAVPANISSVLYVQMRMIAAISYMAGYDLKSDQTQTFVYACLAGVGVNQLVKQFGVKLGVKMAANMVKKIPGKVLIKINQMVGFRLATKFGTKGLINLGKMVPVVGAAVGGGLDFAETRIIGNRAYKWFWKGDFSNEKNEEEIVIEPEDIVELETETVEPEDTVEPEEC